MPTYEYRCECGYSIDKFEKITSSGRCRVCPNCGRSRGLKRQIGAGGGILFHGDGFYQTEYVTPKKKDKT